MTQTVLDSTIDKELRDALPEPPIGRKWIATERGDAVRLDLHSRSPLGGSFAHASVPKADGLDGLADAARRLLNN